MLAHLKKIQSHLQEKMADDDNEPEPVAKRRKLFTKGETLQRLDELSGDVSRAVGGIKTC